MSGAVGANLHEVARGVAERLGFALVDEEIIQRAAADAGVKPEVVADAERRRSFMERALGALGSSSDATGAAAFGVWRETLEPADSQVRDLIRAAIEETALRGDAVIVSHAASHALASRPDVLRVLVTASPPRPQRARRRGAGPQREGRRPRGRPVRCRPGRLPEALLRRQERTADPVRHRCEHGSIVVRRGDLRRDACSRPLRRLLRDEHSTGRAARRRLPRRPAAQRHACPDAHGSPRILRFSPRIPTTWLRTMHTGDGRVYLFLPMRQARNTPRPTINKRMTIGEAFTVVAIPHGL